MFFILSHYHYLYYVTYVCTLYVVNAHAGAQDMNFEYPRPQATPSLHAESGTLKRLGEPGDEASNANNDVYM